LLAYTTLVFPAQASLYRRAHYIMGTLFEIAAYGEDAASTTAAIEEAFGVIREADRVMSSYRADSDLMYLNRHAADGFVSVREDLFRVIEAGIEYGQRSDGAFDITVGPLMRAWWFFRDQGRIPSPAEQARLRSIIGYQHVQLDPARRAIRFEVSGAEIDLGGIAKGWAVDRAADVLRARGITRALIDAGTSSIYALGAPPDQEAWPIGIRDPLRRDCLIAVIGLKDMSLSTSGSYERYVHVRGKRYSHIMNPKTGWPVEDMLSTTVVAPTALASDALSTAVFVMGATRGSALLEDRGLEGLFVYREKRRLATKVVSAPAAPPIYLATPQR
jgi:thiamine biosynthesis lipoprotein